MEEKIITITMQTYSRAQLLKSRFESEDIECFLVNINAVRPTAPADVKVRIKESDLERAMHIINDINNNYGEESIDMDDIPEDIERILVPVDFSDYSLNACEYALGIAEKLNAEIKLFHVSPLPVWATVDYPGTFAFPISYGETVEKSRETAQKKLEEFYNYLQEEQKKNQADINIDYSISNGMIVDEIINMCESYKPGAIIMGTKGKGNKKEGMLGSVTADVIEAVNVPVLAVPETSKYGGINKTNVLYATDFDTSDYKAIKKLMTIIYLFDIKIYCVHIDKKQLDTIDKIKLEGLKDHFNKKYKGFDVECDLLIDDEVIHGLQKFIHEKNIDIIALTTHKRNLITRIFNPSLTKKMLYQADTPLLIFHS